MIIMTKGIVKIKKNRAFVEQQNGEVEVASGQYVYLKVENCWMQPVRVLLLLSPLMTDIPPCEKSEVHC